MKTYRTAQVAQIIGIHPNTVRLYEELGLISRPERRANGYRVFTDLHIAQFCLARTALRVEVLQNGLRANAVEIVKASAAGEFDRALLLTGRYEETLKSERENAEEALRIAGEILSGAAPEDGGTMMTRKEAAACLQVTADTLRNWELNGLLTVKRRQNGYRVYSAGAQNHPRLALRQLLPGGHSPHAERPYLGPGCGYPSGFRHARGGRGRDFRVRPADHLPGRCDPQRGGA